MRKRPPHPRGACAHTVKRAVSLNTFQWCQKVVMANESQEPRGGEVVAAKYVLLVASTTPKI